MLCKLNERPFILDGSPFEPVEAAGACASEPLTVNGEREPPLKVWLAIREEPIKKEYSDRLLPEAVAGEDALVLYGNSKSCDRKNQSLRISVLVSKNQEACL